MQWGEFGPYVHPFVIGCPEPTMHHHARLAAIEFCKKTLCWTRQMDDSETDGSELLELDPDTDTQVIRIRQVFLDGKEMTLADTVRGFQLRAADTSQSNCFTETNQEIYFRPVPDAGLPVVVRAAIAPSRLAKTFHNDLAEFIEDIAHGTVARIMRVPNQAFSNMAESAVHEAAFRQRINTIGMKVGRGLAAAKLKGRAGFL